MNNFRLAPSLIYALTIASSISGTVALAQDFLNNRDYIYTSPIGKERTCQNIRWKEKRRRYLCSTQIEVRRNCPQTCGIACIDDPIFKLKKKSNGERKPCSWLRGPSKESSKRLEMYCPPGSRDKNNGRILRDACPFSCQFCQTFVPPVAGLFPITEEDLYEFDDNYGWLW